MANKSENPALRWGIIGAGRIAAQFASDMVLVRPNAKASHQITAIGSSSIEKGNKFSTDNCKDHRPAVYGSYEGVYTDPNVDIVYISTPHAIHKENVLDAIAAGKHVLCEKPMCMNAAEAEEMINAAKKSNVFLMEGVWTRFFPLTRKIQDLVHSQKVIGSIARVWCDFGIKFDMSKLPSTSRLKNPKLGASAALDIGLYSITWGTLLLEPEIAPKAPKADIIASAVIQDEVDTSTAMILSFEGGNAQGILTCSMSARTGATFAKVEGSKGTISIEGHSAGRPSTIVIKLDDEVNEQTITDNAEGSGFYYEADAVALDIAAGRLQNDIMPWAETMRIMGLLDEVRRQIKPK